MEEVVDCVWCVSSPPCESHAAQKPDPRIAPIHTNNYYIIQYKGSKLRERGNIGTTPKFPGYHHKITVRHEYSNKLFGTKSKILPKCP
jgi:hypothetical protein